MRTVAVVVSCLALAGEAAQEDTPWKTLANLLAGQAASEAFSVPGARMTSRTNRWNPLTMMARKPIVGGNWKCNPAKPSDLEGLVANINACDTTDCDVYVCPSPLHVDYCCGKFTNAAMVTPQNCNFKGCGAFTGEMAVEQMKDMGITNVLIGHSERRGEFGIFPMDTNDTLAVKLKYILDAGMTCAYCIGEPLPIREEGLDAVLAEMDKQLAQIYSLLDPATAKSLRSGTAKALVSLLLRASQCAR